MQLGPAEALRFLLLQLQLLPMSSESSSPQDIASAKIGNDFRTNKFEKSYRLSNSSNPDS